MKGIPMKTWEVRAILDGRKTMIRRVVKPQPLNAKEILDYDGVLGYADFLCENIKDGQRSDRIHHVRPTYKTFDTLYVKETWQEVYETEVDEENPCGVVNIRERILNFDEISKVEAGISRNCATTAMKPRMKYYVFKESNIEYSDPKNGLYWRPSIHMPRKAARIFLRVTDVRVERLHNMPHDSPLKEGIRWRECPDGFTWEDGSEKYCCYTTPMGAIRALWNSTIKSKDCTLYGWETNPWVWVIEFERCEKPKEENHETD